MDDKQVDEVWMALYKQEHYMLPYSSGEFMVYHHGPNRFGTATNIPHTHYEIIRPKKFRIKLYYEDGLIKLAKDKTFPSYSSIGRYQNIFVEIPMQIKLEDYFEIRNWRGRDIPVALKRFETEYKVERLFNLFVFT